MGLALGHIVASNFFKGIEITKEKENLFKNHAILEEQQRGRCHPCEQCVPQLISL
jgi:hypothetical protein